MKTPALGLLLSLVLATLAADQVTKYLAVSRLTTALDGREGVAARLEGFVSERNLDNYPPEPGAFSRATRPYLVLPDYWHFRYVENPGAAWGMLGTLPDSVRRPFFHGVSLAALGFIFWMYARLGAGQRWVRAALALVAGGALGNFVDRLLRGYVIDFIDWHWRNQPGMRWPTFNVADAAICVGVGLLLADSLRVRRPAAEGAGGADPVAPLTDGTLVE
ncbi:signal peptidase II [Aggregicoccus sp. 17bor-14]|uniref:signal peptidase II n=1 Tax=Myxococcaceae TaxID=31 RepID=UPI00129C97E3|nr:MULTISPECIES: signal peptidase II [Myxococcaceae]MBF5045797.1 signal peptidase II [Simulacricoccus sp. 17bor-14]MRI91532.1 signal peptidase II [Aggregicoccus sp. 17bor-14]